MSVSRRSFLSRSAAVVGGVGLMGMATSARAQAKVSQASVAYQETPKDGHSCAGCALFEPPNACKIVEGTISPSGWCKLWTAKDS